MKDEEIKKLLRTDRELAFRKLYYKVFPAVAKWVSQRGGTADDAADVFHDGLVLVYEICIHRPESISGPLPAFTFGTVRNLWYRKLRNSNIALPLEGLLFEPANEPHISAEPRPDHTLFNLLQQAGQKCLHLLEAFYYRQHSLEKISQRFGFKSVRSATVQKYKCLEKLRKFVKKHSLEYEELAETVD